jgi:hypothetical protein
VSHRGLAVYNKRYHKSQKKNYENSNISPCKNIIFKKKKNPLKSNQNPSRYYNSIITNLNFQHKPKNIIIFQKSSYKKIDILLPRSPKSLKLTIYSIMNLKHNILALVGKAKKHALTQRQRERERELHKNPPKN